MSAKRTHGKGAAVLGRSRQEKERRVRELQEDPGFDALRRQPARRVLVVAGYALAAGSGVLGWVELGGVANVAAPIVFLVGIGVAFVLHRALRNTIDAPDEALDERLIAVRDAAHRRAYSLVSWAMLAALFGLLLGGGASQDQLEGLIYLAALVLLLTPTAIVAWQEPDV